MGLIHKTKFIPFIDVATNGTPSWKQIKKSTTFSLTFNPQTKTFDFISSENPEEEIDSYQPALSQSLTMFDDEDDDDWDYDEDEDDEDSDEGFDFGDEETTVYEVQCACGNIIDFDEDLLESGSSVCDKCGETLEFSFEDEDEE